MQCVKPAWNLYPNSRVWYNTLPCFSNVCSCREHVQHCNARASWSVSGIQDRRYTTESVRECIPQHISTYISTTIKAIMLPYLHIGRSLEAWSHTRLWEHGFFPIALFLPCPELVGTCQSSSRRLYASVFLLCQSGPPLVAHHPPQTLHPGNVMCLLMQPCLVGLWAWRQHYVLKINILSAPSNKPGEAASPASYALYQ